VAELTRGGRGPGDARVALYAWALDRRPEGLEAFVKLTGSTEQHPVLMDCFAPRAPQKGRGALAELKAVSPAGRSVTEGRIVAAGSLPTGKLPEAIKMLERGPVSNKRVGSTICGCGTRWRPQ